MNENIRYFIVYPRGDKKKLSIISLGYNSLYELDDYAVASRKDFLEIDEAVEYAKELARKHGLELDSSEREIQKEINYLD